MSGRIAQSAGVLSIACAVLLLGANIGAAQAADESASVGVLVSDGRLPADTSGEVLYEEKCAMCHEGPGMGTGLLSRRMEVAELSKRGGLPEAFVFQAARIGIGNMPPVPPGEVSDAELRRIAAYLARSEPSR